MAKSKTKATSARRAAATEAPKSDDTREEQVAFDRERNALPEPSAAQREGLLLTCSADRARSLGATTRATELAPEARRTLLGVVESVKTHGAKLRYRPERLRFAMNLVHELELSIERQEAKHAGRRVIASSRARAEAEANAVRAELVRALGPVVSANADEAKTFAAARGNIATGTDVAKSIDDLAAQAKRWLAHSNAALRALAELQGIDEPLLHRAGLAAKALRAARDDTSIASGKPMVDSPETNELEGRVLVELGELRSAFENNRGETGVALPTLGKTTTRALRRGRDDAPAPSEPTDPA